MKQILILGPGCKKCQTLFKLCEQAAADLNLDCEIGKVTDITEITKFGVMMTPALVVDGEVKLVGKVPPVEELKKLIA
jgi:small redox-active disulfide protein 2